jgi:hypothetical protein
MLAVYYCYHCLTVLAIVYVNRDAAMCRSCTRVAAWVTHVHAGQGHPAFDGQPLRHDPADLCQRHPAIPGHHCQLFHPPAKIRLLQISSLAFRTSLALLAQATGVTGRSTSHGGRLHLLLYFCLFDQQNYGENLKKVGATVPWCAYRRAHSEIFEHGSKPHYPGWARYSSGWWRSCHSCLGCYPAFNMSAASSQPQALFLSLFGFADRRRCGA